MLFLQTSDNEVSWIKLLVAYHITAMKRSEISVEIDFLNDKLIFCTLTFASTIKSQIILIHFILILILLTDKIRV